MSEIYDGKYETVNFSRFKYSGGDVYFKHVFTIFVNCLFFVYRTILSNNYRAFAFDNLRKHLLPYQ